MIRGFYHLSEAWYGESHLKNRDDVIDEINIGFFGPEGKGGTTGEFTIRWESVGGKVVPRLCVYSDGWEALAYFSDLLAALARIDSIDPPSTAVCRILKRLGIKDLTPRKRP